MERVEPPSSSPFPVPRSQFPVPRSPFPVPRFGVAGFERECPLGRIEELADQTNWQSISLITPAEFYLGRVAEARGDRDQARYHYDRFVRWWKDCDPELKPWWKEGRKALARVTWEPRTTP